MSGWPTPIADGALRNPVGIPPNVDQWLRGIEMRARSMHARLEQACAASQPLPALRSAFDELSLFLGEDAASPFRRLLRRPLARLALHLPASRAFDAYVRRMFERGNGAIELQAAAEAFRREMEGVAHRYSRLPYFTATWLAEARVTATELERAQRVENVESLRRRMARVVRRLEELERYLPPTGAFPSPSSDTARSGIPPSDTTSFDTAPSGIVESSDVAQPLTEPTVPELRAALALRLERRAAARPPEDTADTLRAAGALHVAALGSAGGWASPARESRHVVAERLALEAMRPGESLAPEGEDVDLWGGLLGSATAALYGQPGEGWQAQLPVDRGAEDDSDVDGTRTILYAVPIDDTFVCLTPAHPAPVRVHARRARVGDVVDCRIFAEDAETELSRALAVDPLFDGIAPDAAGWYVTGTEARVRVFAGEGGDWFGRVERKGAAKLLATPGWQPAVDEPGALRVVAGSRPGPEPLAVGGDAREPVTFLGTVSREVRTPFAEHPWGWLKTPVSPGGLDAERDLFHALAPVRPGMALRLLGTARTRPQDGEGFLYARPFAFRLGDSPPLRSWMDGAARYAFVRAVARAAAGVHEAGFALGVYHPDAFAFGVEWDTEERGFRPSAVVVEAPCARRFGERFSPPADALATSLEFPRLRFRGVAPVIRVGDTATPETDAMSFGLMVLELLATRPLPVQGWLPWDRIPQVVAAHGSCFTRPALATKVAACLESVAHSAQLLSFMRSLTEK
jgi:hypothetical protein